MLVTKIKMLCNRPPKIPIKNHCWMIRPPLFALSLLRCVDVRYLLSLLVVTIFLSDLSMLAAGGGGTASTNANNAASQTNNATTAESAGGVKGHNQTHLQRAVKVCGFVSTLVASGAGKKHTPPHMTTNGFVECSISSLVAKVVVKARSCASSFRCYSHCSIRSFFGRAVARCRFN